MADLDSHASGAAQRRDTLWLVAALVGAALLHFGWTVPRGPFVASSRNRDRSHAAFIAMRDRYASRSFEKEPRKGAFGAQMQHALQRAVQMVRSRAIAKGSRHWSKATKVRCKTTRCQFELCIPQGERDHFDAGLAAFRIAGRPAWELKTLSSGACMRYEVLFLMRPSEEYLLSLDNFDSGRLR